MKHKNKISMQKFWSGCINWLSQINMHTQLTITGIILAHFASVWTGKLTYFKAWTSVLVNWSFIYNIFHLNFHLKDSKQIILKNRHSILESLWRPNYAVISNGLPHTDKLLSVCLTLIQGSTYKLEQQDRWLSDSPKKGNKKNPLSNWNAECMITSLI